MIEWDDHLFQVFFYPNEMLANCHHVAILTGLVVVQYVLCTNFYKRPPTTWHLAVVVHSI